MMASSRQYLFPAIDLREGKVVRLVQGDYEQQTIYADDPVAQAKQFEHAGATWLHLVDLDGARSGQLEHHEQIRSVCAQTDLKIQVGGGVRDELAIDQLLEVGVERVVIGTAAFRDWNWFEALVAKPVYEHRIVLGLDARSGRLAVSGWDQTTDLEALDVAKQVSDWPLSAIVYTDIATDGTLAGPNVDLTRQVVEKTQVPIVASGGVGSLEHLRQLRQLPIQGAIVGKALYEQAFALTEALEAFEQSL